MAELSNKQLTSFANNNLRIEADILQKLVISLPLHVAVYNARDLGTVINEGGASNLLQLL